jgi:2-oxoglutarate ferredoxin oxidoreductase subunit delta
MAQPERPPAEGKKAAKPKKAPPKIEIKLSWCKSCGICVEYCNPGTLEMEGIYPVVVDAATCTRCMQCEAMCPDFCIKVRDDDAAPETEEDAAS